MLKSLRENKFQNREALPKHPVLSCVAPYNFELLVNTLTFQIAWTLFYKTCKPTSFQIEYGIKYTNLCEKSWTERVCSISNFQIYGFDQRCNVCWVKVSFITCPIHADFVFHEVARMQNKRSEVAAIYRSYTPMFYLHETQLLNMERLLKSNFASYVMYFVIWIPPFYWGMYNIK